MEQEASFEGILPEQGGPSAEEIVGIYHGRLLKGQEPTVSCMKMSDLGANCPIGIFTGGVRHRDFEVEDIDFSIEMELLEEKEKRRLFPPAFVTAVLARCLKRIGGIDFTSMDKPTKEQFIAEMYMADVLYIYAVLRRLTMGPDSFSKVKCPNCGIPVEFGWSLDDLDVYVLDLLPTNFCWLMDLHKPILIDTVEGIKSVNGLWIAPTRWGSMMTLLGGITTAVRTKMLVKSHIVSAEPPIMVKNVQIVIRDEHLMAPKVGLSKVDYEEMSASLDYNSPGLRLIVKGKCTGAMGQMGCGWEVAEEVDWRYDAFFKRSRPSRARKTI